MHFLINTAGTWEEQHGGSQAGTLCIGLNGQFLEDNMTQTIKNVNSWNKNEFLAANNKNLK